MNYQPPGHDPDATHPTVADAWEVRLPADAHAVPASRHAAVHACRQMGASEEDCLALDLALGEALANAVTHGASPDSPPAPSAVSVCLWRHRGSLIVEVRDHGPGFDPPPPPYAMPTGGDETHGRGLPLMERLTDALLVSRGDARTGGAVTFLVRTLPGG